MGFPEWLMILWMGLSWVDVATHDGEIREIKHNAGGALAKYLILGIVLYWGGFFA